MIMHCSTPHLLGLPECLFHFIPGSPDHLGHRYCKPQRNKPEPSVDRQDPARRRRLSDRLAPSDRLRLQRNHPDPVTLPVPRSEVSLHSGLLHESLMGSPRLPRLHPDQPLQRETWHLPEIFFLPLLPGTPFTVRFDPSLLFSELMA